MKDIEAQKLVATIKKEFPHTHAVIANQPGRSASWAIVEVRASASSNCFTLTSAEEWKRLKEIMQILLPVEAKVEMGQVRTVQDVVVEALQKILDELNALPVLPQAGSDEFQARFEALKSLSERAAVLALMTIPDEVKAIHEPIEKRFMEILSRKAE